VALAGGGVAREVDDEAALAAEHLGEVEGEAVGGVEIKRDVRRAAPGWPRRRGRPAVKLLQEA
jgi:hypothetical protein